MSLVTTSTVTLSQLHSSASSRYCAVMISLSLYGCGQLPLTDIYQESLVPTDIRDAEQAADSIVPIEPLKVIDLFAFDLDSTHISTTFKVKKLVSFNPDIEQARIRVRQISDLNNPYPTSVELRSKTGVHRRWQGTGSYDIIWDGKDEQDHLMDVGTYEVRLMNNGNLSVMRAKSFTTKSNPFPSDTNVFGLVQLRRVPMKFLNIALMDFSRGALSAGALDRMVATVTRRYRKSGDDGAYEVFVHTSKTQVKTLTVDKAIKANSFPKAVGVQDLRDGKQYALDPDDTFVSHSICRIFITDNAPPNLRFDPKHPDVTYLGQTLPNKNSEGNHAYIYISNIIEFLHFSYPSLHSDALANNVEDLAAQSAVHESGHCFNLVGASKTLTYEPQRKVYYRKHFYGTGNNENGHVLTASDSIWYTFAVFPQFINDADAEYVKNTMPIVSFRIFRPVDSVMIIT